MKIAFAIATAGRREGLSQTVDFLRRQTQAMDALYICPAGDNDLDPECLKGFPSPCFVVRGPRGLPAQRNTIIRDASGMDILAFIDDDYLPAPDFIEKAVALFETNPGMVILTGNVVADGINGPGIPYEEAVKIIETLPANTNKTIRPTFGGYGCNMCVRMSAVRESGQEFDENLPLYGWWEDIDFSRRLVHLGSILQAFSLRGVHMGSKSGRTPGKRLGYSQVINIVYMMKKGTVPARVGLVRILRNLISNIVRSFAPEPWVDRKGRLAGNLMALGDAAMGKIDPGKILKL